MPKVTEKLEFQAEVKKMLDIVIHSLYNDISVHITVYLNSAED